MGSSSRQIGVASTTKHTEVSIRRIYVEQSDIWGARSVDGFGGKSVKEVCGC
jgi:hypothetical protein